MPQIIELTDNNDEDIEKKMKKPQQQQTKPLCDEDESKPKVKDDEKKIDKVDVDVEFVTKLKLTKDEGNKRFNSGDYCEALILYKKALKLIKNQKSSFKDEQLALYKNIAAVHLKLENYQEAIDAADQALKLSSTDVKSLFRRCLAYEQLKKYDEAFKDALMVIRLEPQNAAIQPVMSRLNVKLQEVAKQMSSTASRAKQMLDLVDDFKNVDAEKREQAANNLLVLARDEAGARFLVEKCAIFNKLKKLLHLSPPKETTQEITLASIRCLSELSRTGRERTLMMLDDKQIGIEFLVELMKLKSINRNEALVTAWQFLMQTFINSLSGYEPKENKKPNKDLLKQYEKELDKIMLCLLKYSPSPLISGKARDAILELIMKNSDYEVLFWGQKLVDANGLENLLEIASVLEELHYESAMEITPNTRTHVAVALERIFLCMDHDKAREKYLEKVMEFINAKLKGLDIDDKVRATAAITALLQGPLDAGNHCLAQQGVVEMMVAMAGSEDEVQQRVAAEALIAAASKKDKCKSIASMGANILKNLYKSANDKVKVRALVGLCKLGSVGGTDASVRPFSDGSTLKLASACRKFLINPAKDRDLRKWAVEGLAYLTLDADVKEELIADDAALTALIELAKSGDLSALHGVVTLLVNLTNSYDKENVLPELVKLAQFAKQHVPEEHEKDDKEFIDKRCKTLCQKGVTSALVALYKSESKTSREYICRIFNAICEHQELRGMVVAQGGAKALVNMALETNTDKGKLQGAQALARIGVTMNPEIAFPGQRCAEVVRPIMSLLHPDCSGLENFEALMALTNLAQVSPSVRKRLLQDCGFTKIEHYVYEEHVMLRRAAIQCITNLITQEEVVKLYEGENDRVKFLVILCEEDDLDTAKAAAGALAMLTSVSKKACQKFFTAKRWLETLIMLVSTKDADLQHRGMCIVYNLIDSDESAAEKIVETTVLEVLMAVIRPEVDDIDEKIKDIARAALERAEEQKLIKSTEEGVSNLTPDDADD